MQLYKLNETMTACGPEECFSESAEKPVQYVCGIPFKMMIYITKRWLLINY